MVKWMTADPTVDFVGTLLVSPLIGERLQLVQMTILPTFD